MVEANTDSSVVTAVILRETRDAAAERDALAASSRASTAPASLAPAAIAPQIPATATVSEPPPAPVAPTEPGISGGMRIVFAGVLVLVLVLAWFAERGGGQKGS